MPIFLAHARLQVRNMNYTIKTAHLSFGSRTVLDLLPPILNHDLSMVFQPIHTRMGKLFGHELLLRFKDYGTPTPLLRIVHQLQLRAELDFQVCQLAIQHSARKSDIGCWIMNLSADSLFREEILSAVQELARQLSPSRLILHLLDLELSHDKPKLLHALQLMEKSQIGLTMDTDEIDQPCCQALSCELLRMNIHREEEANWNRWCHEAQRRDIPLLAYWVENDAQRVSVLRHPIDLLQGHGIHG